MSTAEDSEEPRYLEERPAGSSAELDYESDDSGGTEGSDRDEVASQLTVGSAKPVKGEAFCECYKTGREKECICGEDDSCTL